MHTPVALTEPRRNPAPGPPSWCGRSGDDRGALPLNRPVGRPSLVVVHSQPTKPEDSASAEDALRAREDQALHMVESALKAMGGELKDSGLAGFGMEVGPQGVAELI